MLACAAVTQQRLLFSRLFRGHCIATGLHATVFKSPLSRLSIDDYSKTTYSSPHPYTITASRLPARTSKHVLLCVGEVKAISSFTVIRVVPFQTSCQREEENIPHFSYTEIQIGFRSLRELG
jgi:hypothetical protein